MKNQPKWYSLTDETLQLALTKNKAIFLFVSYETCELCQKMEEEVLSHEKVLQLLDKYFISIKIDKDKEVDVDRYYQKAHYLLNKRKGGWPLSIFLTPDNKPFFAGTYIAKDSEVGSIEGMGFQELAELIGSKIAAYDKDIEKNATEIDQFLQKKVYPTQATKLDFQFSKNFMLQVKNNYEVKYGGFSEGVKFPQVATLSALMAVDTYFEDKAAKAMLLHTMHSMINGKYYDNTQGGFFRFSSSNDWNSPSQDKTLYDNALLSELYLKVFLRYNEEIFLKTAFKTADFMIHFMRKDELFISTIVNDNKDEKIQTSLNSLMIHSLFLLGTQNTQYKQLALTTLDALEDFSVQDTKILHTKNQDGFFDDYVFIAQVFLDAYTHTNNEHYLIKAQRIINLTLEKFYDNGDWNFTEDEHYKTSAELSDNIYKSGVSTMVDILILLSNYLKDEKYKHFAFKTLEYNSYELGRKPSVTPSLLESMFHYLNDTNVL